MSDDPFREDNDSDATIIRPTPGGRATATSPPPRPQAETVSAAIAPPAVGLNKLVAAAAPVLAAVLRLGDARTAPDPDQLKRGFVAAIRAFEGAALATGLDTLSLRSARYALCATVDDLVLSTPWGSRSSWTAQSLTSIFHNEVSGGERFFDILTEMQRDLGRHAEVVELMYVCLALGFEGRYRVMPRGSTALAELREGVFRTIRQRRGAFERELSPHWRGTETAWRGGSAGLPAWITAVATLAAACVIYVAFDFSLAGASDIALTRLNALPPQGPVSVPRAVATPPPPASAAPDDFADRLRRFLAPEIRAHLVTVLDDAQTVTVRLTARDLFASGTATLNPHWEPLIERIGSALQTEAGRVNVDGYTDDQPIHTVRFPSNWQLSQARATAVAGVIGGKLADPGRVHAVGRADADPIATNATAEGRQANRRTEIVLLRTTAAP